MPNWLQFLTNKSLDQRPTVSSGIDVDQHKHNAVLHCLSSDSTPSLFSMLFGKKEPRTAVFRQSSQIPNADSLYPALFLLRAFKGLWLRVLTQRTHQPKKQIY